MQKVDCLLIMWLTHHTPNMVHCSIYQPVLDLSEIEIDQSEQAANKS